MQKINSIKASIYLSHLPNKLSFSPALAKNAPGISQVVGSIEQIEAQLQSYPSTQNIDWQKLFTTTREATEHTLEFCKQKHLSVISYFDADYPARLRHLTDSPWTLYVLGSLPQNQPTLSVVGSRTPDGYGQKLIYDILTQLDASWNLQHDLQMVSGFARGIDALAHQRACAMALKNFAVLGSGHAHLYPKHRDPLDNAILDAGGGLLSELPPHAPPTKWQFPWRNRIIAALADVLWVVQGQYTSGTRSTAVHALNLGRTVTSSPGEITNPLSQLPHQLINDGAHLISNGAELKQLLQANYRPPEPNPENPR